MITPTITSTVSAASQVANALPRAIGQGVLAQVLDPGSLTQTLFRQSAFLLPWLPAAAGLLSGLAKVFQPSGLMLGMAVSGGKNGGNAETPPKPLPDEVFEEGWLNYLRFSPELASVDDMRELISRIERKASAGRSTIQHWLILSEIGSHTEDPQVQELAARASEARQKVFEVGLEPLSGELRRGPARPLWTGLRKALADRHYDQAVDFTIALLRRNDPLVNCRLVQYPHPMVRSFVYGFLVSFGHWEKVALFWKEFESLRFGEDMENGDDELRRFSLGTLKSVLAVSSERERAYAILLHFALRMDNKPALRATVKLIADSPHGREGSPLSYLLFCLLNPDDPKLRFLTRTMLARLVGQFEIRG